jgi:hypothetical protein
MACALFAFALAQSEIALAIVDGVLQISITVADSTP